MKREVIDVEQLPKKIPVLEFMVLFLLCERFHITGFWAGLVAAFCVVKWVTAVYLRSQEEKREVLFKNKPLVNHQMPGVDY